MTISVEDWGASYGSAYLVQSDDSAAAAAVIVEDHGHFSSHRTPLIRDHRTIAFVDGVRRGEASLYQHDPATGLLARGVAGGHACGSVIADGNSRPEFGETRVRRLVIWGSGVIAPLPTVRGCWTWDACSVADSSPDAPLSDLQTRMRQAEGSLAELLCQRGHLVVVDGPLNFVRSRDLPVVGYVKSHYRALLGPEYHRRIPELMAGERCSIFQLGEDRYSCYLRLTAPTATSGPWSGIVRLEIPQSAGLTAAIDVADQVAGIIPRFAGIPHRDPRAPQNLQPIGALESHLRHLLGDAGLATRAVREAVAQLL
jgi:hypothetical protein